MGTLKIYRKTISQSPIFPSMSDEFREKPLVLVTGATGYVASHVIHSLLNKKLKVRGTVRDLKDKAKQAHLKDLSSEYEKNPVNLVQADLLFDQGWQTAVTDCQYVIHVAAPYPIVQPSKEDEILRPTVDGTLRVLKACAMEAKKGLLKRVVMLNNIGAIHGETDETNGRVLTEDDWTDPDSPLIDLVAKSKTLAEMKAWDFVRSLTGDERFDFTVVVGAFTLGPVFNKKIGTSQEMLYRLMDRKRMPMLPEIQLNLFDVRGLAEVMIESLFADNAAGERLLVVSGRIWVKEAAAILQEEFISQGYKISQTSAPYSLLWVASVFDQKMKHALRLCNKEYNFNGSKTNTLLGITLRNLKTTLIDTAYSYIEHGILHKTEEYTGPN